MKVPRVIERLVGRDDETSAIVEIPLRRSRAFLSHYLEGKLEPRHQRVLRCALDALVQRGAKLQGGWIVKSNIDVVRYLLEQVGEQMPEDLWTAPGIGS